jgi:hypothetical protein
MELQMQREEIEEIVRQVIQKMNQIDNQEEKQSDDDQQYVNVWSFVQLRIAPHGAWPRNPWGSDPPDSTPLLNFFGTSGGGRGGMGG